MAELNQHDEIAGGVDRGAFYAVMSAMASRDPKRVALAEGDAFTALQSIGSMLNVVADYLYLRAQNPDCLLYTSDAADEEDSGDLGGRRTIKKKKQKQQRQDKH